MVHSSPLLLKNLDWDDSEPQANTIEDPRFSLRSLTLESTGFSDVDSYQHDDRPLSRPSNFSARRKRRERASLGVLARADSYSYSSRLKDDEFRIAILQPGSGADPIACNLVTEHWKSPTKDYRCLSYAWGSSERDAAVLLDGANFPVTQNLLNALQRLRNPKSPVKYWIDQICINQDDLIERAQQVDVMKHIFNQARKIHVWLGESDARSEMLFTYAKQIKRTEESSQRQLQRIGGHRNVRHAMKALLERDWFKRVWVIPEVVLAQRTTVRVAAQTMTWEMLVKLIRYVSLPSNPGGGFNKETSLPGNPRQRIAIITQMIASQRDQKHHTDISQLLILGKSSQATVAHDTIYAFYGLTYLSIFPDYSMAPEVLFVDIMEYYIWNILESEAYALIHQLTRQQKSFQVMSILYSAGILHQDHERHDLPSWTPDWTSSWHLPPIWCKTIPNFVSTSSRDEWSSGIRSDYRAGGELGELGEFEVVKDSHHVRLSALIIDRIRDVTETPTPGSSQVLSASPSETWGMSETSTLQYGRCSFATIKGYTGLATRGVAVGDRIAILLGGDVPVVARRAPEHDGQEEAYQLLCECYVESPTIMFGDYHRANWTSAQEIVFV